LTKEHGMGSVTYLIIAGSGTLILAVIVFLVWRHCGNKRERQSATDELRRNEESEAKAQAQAKADEEARRTTEAQSQRLAEERRAAEEKASQEAEVIRLAEAQRLAEEKARAEAEAKAQEEARRRAKAEVRARAEAEAKAKAEAEAREQARLAAETKAKRLAEKRIAEEIAAAEAKAREEARRKAEAETKARAEAEAKAKAEVGGDADRVPKEYKFPTPEPGISRKRERKKRDSNFRERPFEIRVTAHPDHHGFCTFSILAKRPTQSPPELNVRCGNESVALIEYNEAWYEAAATDELMAWLSGVVFTDKRKGDTQHSWQLSSRPLHVLAVEQGFGSLVSTTRMCVGRKHLVLCRAHIVQEVQRVLAEVGCPGFVSHGEDFGSPNGWVFLWPVTPSQPRPPVDGDETLNALRPQAELDLVLEGGVWLHDSTWLEGYPPQITVSGVRPPDQPVHINRVPALEHEDGSYSTPGCDKPGDYSVWCAGKSRSYSIAEPQVMCDRWQPHSYHGGSVCGALVTTSRDASQPPVTVPASNSVLIGAEPGQIFYCPPQVGTEWTGFVPFPVVWALPADPLRCDRSVRKIVLLTRLTPKASDGRIGRPRKTDSSYWRWSKAIRDCRRKGLALSPGDEGAEALWWAYVVRAGGRLRRRQKRGH
jgi:hypothetical protein